MRRNWILLAVLMCILCLTGCGGEDAASQSGSEGPAAESVGASASVSSGGEAAEPEIREAEYCTWPGFMDLTVTAEHHVLTLANDADNTVIFTFVITEEESGAVLYESGTVAPGEEDLWDVYEAYTTGSHTIIITTTAETGNRLEQQIVLTLPEEGE
ncbi:MAG: hypothetical protein LUG45_02815 [Clostridiales bacterium]|nr:hypothetical protein [Clostridiales bacterium]